MISSFFGKTKPINYIILLVFLFVFYWYVHFSWLQSTFEPQKFLGQAGILGLLMLSIFLVNFILKKNKITGGNSLAILFYTLLVVIFPATLADHNAIIASFFLLLAIRRLLSFKSLKNLKLKIFDASFWIMMASLFYDWAILYLLVVYIAIYFYEAKNIRNWLVPLVAVIAHILITMAYLVLTDNMDFMLGHYQLDFHFDQEYFLELRHSFRFGTYVFLSLLLAVLGFIKLSNVGVGKLVLLRLIVLWFLTGLMIKVLKSSQEVKPIMLTFFPGVVFIANYVEGIKKKKIREMVLWAAIILSFVVFVTASL
ncbi:hypothetical protein SAMN04487911_10174 [Arenibacter nanhaiticus]|uniref:EpsG family protein n=1 Tax=Arenibacter nanhaiticus TaxID=558155 RepID=A0A1M6A4H2_9FLAO|nr:DUF6427 family protein [Arenibacter nanhaiticus]SHI31295.1 hypothetical protein SAMN04487911_10174 [Arenibacter nanhaiticus]